MNRRLFAGPVALHCMLCLVACAGTQAARPEIAPKPPAPTVITRASYGDALRRFLSLPFSDPGREPLRQRIVEHIVATGPDATASDPYEALVAHFESITSLYAPAELGDGLVPPGLEATARALYEQGSPRGDEARVLSALFVLRALRPNDPEPGAMYDKIKEWGFSARAALHGPLERFQEGLVEVWEEHAWLTPSPAVLTTLTQLYVERRDELIRLFQGGGRPMPGSDPVLDGVRHTAVEVAAVYLRHGDLNQAFLNVQALGSSVGVEAQLLELIENAQDDSPEGAVALIGLIRTYDEMGRTDVARGLALYGVRSRPLEPAFAVRLGRLAADEGDFEGAMGWYGEAVRLAPDERSIYDEILEVLSGLMERGLFGTDLEQTRVIGNRAAQILEKRLARWPEPAPPVRPEELYLALGVAEMNSGHPEQAEARMRAGLAAKDSVAGQLQLGFLLSRLGRNREATECYKRALQLVSERERDPDPPRRAEILESLGDALRLNGDAQEAEKAYSQGLAVWDANLTRLRGPRMGLAQLRRGILLGRLEKPSDARTAFEQAMELAPEVRETYATILVHLLVSEPDSAFAHRVFRHALNQLSLEPEWKVYFALWLRAIAARTGSATDGDVDQVLAEMAAGRDWFAKLAQFAQGKLDYAALLAAAIDVGQRTEAHFYEGMRRLAMGDSEGAREMLGRVLQGQMVSFYEFAIAQELSARAPTPGAPPTQSAETTQPPAAQPVAPLKTQ